MYLYDVPNVGLIHAGTYFTLANVQYPPNWLDLATPSELIERGIIRIEAADPAAFPAPPELVSYAAAKRYSREISGCVWNGHPVATDRDSQAKLMAEFVAISAGLRADPSPWKFADGSFLSVSNAEMSAICLAARAHIAGAFAIEAEAVAAINAGTITGTTAIDALFA